MTQHDPSPRFVVHSITGYSGGRTGNRGPTTSYWVQDLDYNRTVATYYGEYQGQKAPVRLACAEADAARFNAWHDAWLAEEQVSC